MVRIEIFHVVFERAPRHVATVMRDGSIESALQDAYECTQAAWVSSRGETGACVEPTPEVLTDKRRCRGTTLGDCARVIDAQEQETFWRFTYEGVISIASVQELQRVGPGLLFEALGLTS